jgi:hypothetical protein
MNKEIPPFMKKLREWWEKATADDGRPLRCG